MPNLNLALSIKSIPPDVLSTSILVPPVVLPMASISDNVSTVSTCESTYAFIDCCVARCTSEFEAMLSSSFTGKFAIDIFAP